MDDPLIILLELFSLLNFALLKFSTFRLSNSYWAEIVWNAIDIDAFRRKISFECIFATISG